MAHHLTPEERDRIAQLRHQGANQQEIAQTVADPNEVEEEIRHLLAALAE